MSATESEYKGNAILELKNGPDDKYPFSFGLKKAKMIVAHLDEIQQFIERHDTGGQS